MYKKIVSFIAAGIATLILGGVSLVQAKTVCHVGQYGAEVCEEVPEPTPTPEQVKGVHEPSEFEAGIGENLLLFAGMSIAASGGFYYFSKKLA